METRANYLLVGAFAITGIAGIIGLFLWFAQVELNEQFAYFDVRFTSVSGLSDASDVRFAGLPVGQVVDVRLSPNRDGTVLVRLEVDAATPVRADSIATIESQGVTGVSFVGISAGRPEVALLAPTAEKPVPEIAAGRSVIQSLSEEAPALITEALTAVEEVSALFGPENQQRVENILQNAEDASSALATTLEAFAEVPAAVERFSDQVEAFNLILTELTPEVEALLATADTTVGSLGNLSEDARTMVLTANDTLAVAQGTFNQAQRFINEDLTDTTNTLAAIASDLRTEISSVSESARDMLDTFGETGTTATARLDDAKQTLDLANQTLAQISSIVETVEAAARLLETEGGPLLADVRGVVAEVSVAVDAISTATKTDLPAIVADIQSAAAQARETIADLGTDLSSAGGRIDDLSLAAEQSLSQVSETFANANVTLEAINGALATGDRTLGVAQRAFEGADRVINEDIDGIISGLETSLVSLNEAIAQVSDDIPAITNDLRAAGQAAQDAFVTLQSTVNAAGPPVTEFTRTALPLYTRLADETRGLIRNLERLTEGIQRDPARFFLNQQAPEFQR